MIRYIYTFLFCSTIICYGQGLSSSDSCFYVKKYDHFILNEWHNLVENSSKNEFKIEIRNSETTTFYYCLFDSATYIVDVTSYSVRNGVKFDLAKWEYSLYQNFSIKDIEQTQGIRDGHFIKSGFIPIKEEVTQDCCGKTLKRLFVFRDNNWLVYTYFYSGKKLQKVEGKDENSNLVEEIIIY
jgi:hypothetical protein